MKKSTNYKMNLPDLSDQYSVDHWNDNTKIVDTELKNHQDNLNNVNNPTYEVSDKLANLINKESIFTAFGKIAKAILDYITHKDTTTNVHGSTSSPTPNKIVERNTDGRAEIEDGSGIKGIANLKQVQNDIMNKAFIGVKVAMKEDVTPFGEQTLDGVVLSVGDLVLLTNQVNNYNNGVYVVHTGAWSRFENYKSADTINNSVIGVSEGTNKGKLFKTSVESYSENETPLIFFESDYSFFGNYDEFLRSKIGFPPIVKELENEISDLTDKVDGIENEISDFPERIGELETNVDELETNKVGYPNYSASIITSVTSSGVTYTVPEDGFVQILMTIYKNGSQIKINNQTIHTTGTGLGEYVTRFTGQYPMKKGDIIYAKTAYSSELYGYNRIIFYPYR